MTTLTLDAAVPFASFENGGLLYYYGDYAESGYVVSSSRSDEIKLIAWDQAWADTKGLYYSGPGLLANPAYEAVRLVDQAGLPFGIRSVELDSQWPQWQDVEVTFFGITDAGAVTHTVMLDNIEGMQKFTLPDSFSRVGEVSWRAAGPSNIHFDNIEVSHAPTVGADKAVAVVEDSAATPLAIAAPTDIDGDSLSITVTALPDAGMGAVALADGSPVALAQSLTVEELTQLVFTPAADAAGDAGSFAYAVSDGMFTTVQAVAVAITPVADAPTVACPIADLIVVAKRDLAFQVPVESFADADGDALTLSATMADGAALPEWLSFADGTFSGTPPARAGGDVFDIRVSAADASGAVVSDVFQLAVLNPGRGRHLDDKGDGGHPVCDLRGDDHVTVADTLTMSDGFWL